MDQQLPLSRNIVVSIPLRQWLDCEEMKEQQTSQPTEPPLSDPSEPKHVLLLKKVAVAYSLTLLLNKVQQGWLMSESHTIDSVCSLENFAVRFANNQGGGPSRNYEPAWKDIVGLDMISPKISLDLRGLPCLDDSLPEDKHKEIVAKFLEVNIQTPQPPEPVDRMGKSSGCHLLGIMLYQLFSDRHPFPADILRQLKSSGRESSLSGPPRKKIARAFAASSLQGPSSQAFNSSSSMGSAQSEANKQPYVSLLELGFPSSISGVVDNLLECAWNDCSDYAYASLDATCEDLHLLVSNSTRFLFGLGSGGIHFRDKLYGREKESSMISDAFKRVSAGKSEAFFIGGSSGCGKTKLVTSFIESIRNAGVFIVEEKIDLMIQESFSTVISLFDSLCRIIIQQAPPGTLDIISNVLIGEFVGDAHLLAQLLPSVRELCPHFGQTRHESISINQMNTHGVSFLLQRFAKCIASRDKSVVIVLDDLQWADDASLGLMCSVLSGVKDSKIFFVGSYRDNEVDPDHPIFALMYNLQSTNLQLNGLSRESLNIMFSDALGLFPRLSQSLSDLIFHSTDGNPLFSLSSFQSLVRRQMLQYSSEHKRWVWDSARIRSEHLTDNVLCLLTSKVTTSLDESTQAALKIISCFGIKVDEQVVEIINAFVFPNAPNKLLQCLNNAIAGGILEKHGRYFRFVHDKIHEATHNLIPENEKQSHHFFLAKSLHAVYYGQMNVDESILFLVADQFKKAPSFLNRADGLSIDIPGLFVLAGSTALTRSEFPRAFSYFNMGLSLLPPDHWESKYELSLKIYFLVAKSAHSCGHIDSARQSLQQILAKGRCLEDKIESYHLMVSICCDSRDHENAFSMCVKVLSLLDEIVPESIDPNEISLMVTKTDRLISRTSDQTLLEMKEAESRIRFILKFYNQLAIVSHFSKPRYLPWCLCRTLQLSLDHGISVCSVLGLAQYSSMISLRKGADIALACRLGKLALSFENRFDLTELKAKMFVSYVGFTGPYAESFQTCADMHQRGFSTGMSIGDTSCALINAQLRIRSLFLSGTNLAILLEQAEYYLKLATQLGNALSKSYLSLFCDTFTVLIGGDSSPHLKSHDDPSVESNRNFNAHLAIRSYWLGHHERFEHFSEKYLESKTKSVGNIYRDVLLFLQGLNLYQIRTGKNTRKKIKLGNESVESLQSLANHSKSNYKNKEILLRAELFSWKKKKVLEAERLYEAAIEASKQSGFTHEEGLACELAGFFCKKIGKNEKAKQFFTQAKNCYADWGSNLKVNFVASQIN